MTKSIDRFAICRFSIKTELIEVDGDDTFSMYHGTEGDDTITDASCMERSQPLTDRSYYAKPFDNSSTSKINVTISKDDSEAKIISEEKVDRFGNAVEKEIGLDLNDSPTGSPGKTPSSDNQDSNFDAFQEELEEKDHEIQRLKKKLEEVKTKNEKKESIINRLLNESSNKEDTINEYMRENKKNEDTINGLMKENEGKSIEI
jgi:hypothetical protein